MITLVYDYDPTVWLPVPTSFPDESAQTMEAWAAGQAEIARARGTQDSPEAGPVSSYFVEVAKVAQSHGLAHDNVWMLVADDAIGVTLITVDVVEAEASLNDVIADYAKATESQYEPAAVVQMEAAGLGEGCYVVCSEITPDRKVCMTLNFIFRAREYDVVIATQSYDTVAVTAAVPRIQELIGGISVVDEVPAQ